MSSDSNDKVCLVTGATGGIGKAAATALARTGATLVLVGRDRGRTDAVVDELKRLTGNQNISAILGDLSVQADVRRVAAEFKQRFDRLDVLLNNAGGTYLERQLTSDGIEMTLAVNHLNYFLLTNELLDVLKKTPNARIVCVSSDAHRMGGWIPLDDLQSRRRYSGWVQYGATKRMNVMFVRALAKRLAGTNVTVNALHPGFVNTGFAQNNSGLIAKLTKVGMRLFARTPEQGADTAVWLATSPEVAGVSGKYFYTRKEKKPHPQTLDDAACETLWRESEKLVGIA